MTQNSFFIKNRIQEVVRNKEGEGFKFKPTNVFYRELGIHKRRFGQFLRNETQPNLQELAQIATALKVDMKDLF